MDMNFQAKVPEIGNITDDDVACNITYNLGTSFAPDVLDLMKDMGIGTIRSFKNRSCLGYW